MIKLLLFHKQTVMLAQLSWKCSTFTKIWQKVVNVCKDKAGSSTL